VAIRVMSVTHLVAGYTALKLRSNKLCTCGTGNAAFARSLTYIAQVFMHARNTQRLGCVRGSA